MSANKRRSIERGINTRLWTYFASALQLFLTILLCSQSSLVSIQRGDWDHLALLKRGTDDA
jgi:hypothetical protein